MQLFKSSVREQILRRVDGLPLIGRGVTKIGVPLSTKD